MKKFLKTLAFTLAMAMLLSISALAAPAVNPVEGEEIEFELAATADKFEMVAYYDDAIVAGGQYMIFVVAEEDGAYLPTASSILYINQVTAEDDGVVIFENVYPKTMQNSGIMISGTGISEPLLVAEIITEEAVKGDVDRSGAFDIGDATQMLKYLAELVTEAEIDLTVADVDNSGSADIGDVTHMLKVLAHLAEMN